MMACHMPDITPNTANAPEGIHPVRRAREERGLTREGLAWKAGVALRTVDRIESGDVTPHRLTQEAIARVLGAKRNELFPDEPVAA